MRIVVVSTFYSPNMGYTENCLPAALARRGHDVHLVASRLNVYGNSEDYDRNYASFLGPRDVARGTSQTDGYTVHRLDYRLVGGYVALSGLGRMLRELRPDVVHSTAVASLASYAITAMRPFASFRFYTECHQHLSVVRPYLLDKKGGMTARFFFWLTRTLPGSLVGRASELCYAVAPDCAQVARLLYGVPACKIRVQSLGTDTILFHPCNSAADTAERASARSEYGYCPEDIVCLYTGRLSDEKNPLLLADAVAELAARGLPFHSLFIGDGKQSKEILARPHARIIPFVRHTELARFYRMANIGVWPQQESMSMLDAAASGLPIVVSSMIGERDRVIGNGAFYEDGDAVDLANVLEGMSDPQLRHDLGMAGRDKMVDHFSWDAVAEAVERVYIQVVSGRAA
jgi:glycosyltransferase involved in cell wall biosynthesis